MEDKTDLIESLIEKAETYGKTSFEAFKLKTVEKTSDVVSTLVSRGTFILVLSMFTIIINVGFALWLGDILGKTYYGFFCMAGFYGITGIIVYFFLHRWIKKRISNSLIRQILN